MVEEDVFAYRGRLESHDAEEVILVEIRLPLFQHVGEITFELSEGLCRHDSCLDKHFLSGVL